MDAVRRAAQLQDPGAVRGRNEAGELLVELERQLIVGGLVFSHMVTLFVTPVLYLRFGKPRDRAPAPASPPEPAPAAA